MNPYAALFDRQDDRDEHLREVAAGMAVSYKYKAPNGAEKWWHPMKALDDHRRECAALRAELRGAEEQP
jgi:hypothetical protein